MQRCKILIDITKAVTCGTFRQKVICEHQSPNCGIMFRKIVTLQILHISVINKSSLLIEFCRPYEALAVTCSRIASWTCDASFLRFRLRIRFFYEKERKMLIFTVTRHLFFSLLQSNLSTTATLGTEESGSLRRAGPAVMWRKTSSFGREESKG